MNKIPAHIDIFLTITEYVRDGWPPYLIADISGIPKALILDLQPICLKVLEDEKRKLSQPSQSN